MPTPYNPNPNYSLLAPSTGGPSLIRDWFKRLDEGYDNVVDYTSRNVMPFVAPGAEGLLNNAKDFWDDIGRNQKEQLDRIMTSDLEDPNAGPLAEVIGGVRRVGEEIGDGLSGIWNLNPEFLGLDTTIAEGGAEIERGLFGKVVAPNPGEDPQDTKARQAMIADSAKKAEGGTAQPTLEALLKENPDATVDQVAQAKSVDTKMDVEDSMRQSGNWSEGWQEAWDNFNDNIDITAMGMALMAGNDSSKTFSQNLGLAMDYGRKTKEAQKTQDFNQDIMSRRADREDAKLMIDQANAYTARLRAIAENSGMEWQVSDKQSEGYIQNALARAGVDLDEVEGSEAMLKEYGSLLKTEVHNNPSADPRAVADRLIQESMPKGKGVQRFFPNRIGGYFGADYDFK